MADRYPLWNVEFAHTEHPVDNRMATSVFVMTGVDESKTWVMAQRTGTTAGHPRRPPQTSNPWVESIGSQCLSGRWLPDGFNHQVTQPDWSRKR
jgi:hypothetical protein